MSDESKSTETKSETKPASTTATPAETTKTTTTTTTTKSGNKGLMIALLIILLLCCLASLIGGGFGLMNYLGTQNSGTTDTTNGSTTNNGSTGTDGTDGSDGTDGTTPPPTDDEGDFIDVGGGFEVRVDSVRENGDDVEVSMSIKNTSSDPQTFSTLLYLSLVSDTNPEGYVQNFFSARYQEDGAQLDGEIGGGEIDQGIVVYRVNDNPATLTLNVSEGLLSDSFVEIPIL